MKPSKSSHVLQLLISRPEGESNWTVQTVQFDNRKARYFGDSDGIPFSSKKSYLSFCILAIYTSIQQINAGGSTKKLSPLSGHLQEATKRLFQLSGTTRWPTRIFGDNPFIHYLDRTGSLDAKTFSVVFNEGIRVAVSLEGDDKECTDVTILSEIVKKLRLELKDGSPHFLMRIIRDPNPPIDTVSRYGSLTTGEHFRLELLSSSHSNYCVFWVDSHNGFNSTITELFPKLRVDIRLQTDNDPPHAFETFLESQLSGLRIPQESRLRLENVFGCASVLVFSKRTRFTSEATRGLQTLIEGTLPIRASNLFVGRPYFSEFSSVRVKSTQAPRFMGISGPSQPLEWDRSILSCLPNEELDLRIFHIPVT